MVNERALRHAAGIVYKAMILGTLGSMFLFAPLKGERGLAQSGRRTAAVEEFPETHGQAQILWLDSKRVRGQGEGFRIAYEE